ncbi:MAG: hypothetical protein RR063_11925 [Anaerovoracaceae bacterium]
MGFFDKLFGSDASFLGFMDFAGELDNEEPNDEVELTFTIEFEDNESSTDIK